MRHISFTAEKTDERRLGLDRVKTLCEEKAPHEILFHIYAGLAEKELISGVIQDVAEAFPKAHIVGAFSNAEIKDGHVQEPCILVSVLLFDSAGINVHVFKDIGGKAEETGRRIYELIEEAEDLKGVEYLFSHPACETHQIFEQVENCNRTVAMFGGIARGHDLFEDFSYVFDRDGMYIDSLVIVMYSGKDFRLDVDRTAGWDKLGQAFRVTRAEGRRLIEVEHAPAVQIYDKYLQVPQDEHFQMEAAEFPLMMLQDGEQVLRHPEGLDNDGGLILAGDIMEGSRVYMTYGNPSIIFEQINKRCEIVRQFEPQAILLYSCCVRKIFWEDFADNELEPFAGVAPAAGFFTGGEILRDMRSGKIFVHNITLISIAMREGVKTGNKAPRSVVNDFQMQGQASLVRRLAKLVKSTMDEVLALNKRLTMMATTDELTTLYNRREIERRINEAVATRCDSDKPVSLIMLDIDHFKRVNDNYGHDVGDMVLKIVSMIVKRSLKKESGQAAGRWGGEEFFILMPETGLDEAFAFADQIRRSIEAYPFKGPGHLTASFGVITPPLTMELREIFKSVDDALYYAKEHGRNQVVKAEVNR